MYSRGGDGEFSPSLTIYLFLFPFPFFPPFIYHSDLAAKKFNSTVPLSVRNAHCSIAECLIPTASIEVIPLQSFALFFLVSFHASIQIHHDINSRDHDLRGDEHNHYFPAPLALATFNFQPSNQGLVFLKLGPSGRNLPIHSRYSPCFVPTWSFNTANRSAITSSLSVKSPTL